MQYWQNWYEILELPRDAVQADIKKAYFAMLRRYPPEKNQDMFLKIRQAYELLSNAETKRQYDDTFSISPELRPIFIKGLEYYEKKDYGSAIPYLKAVVDAEKKLLFLYAILGDCYFNNGNSGNAIKIYTELVKADGSNASYAGKLADAYMERGFKQKALEQYKKALLLDPDNVSFMMELVRCYKLCDQYDQAEVFVGRALKLAREQQLVIIELYSLAIDTYFKCEAWDSVINCMNEVNLYAAENPAPTDELIDQFTMIYAVVKYLFKEQGISIEIDALTEYILEYTSSENPIYNSLMKDIFFKTVREDKKVDALMHDITLKAMDDCDCEDCLGDEFSMKMTALQSMGKYRKAMLYMKEKYPKFYDLNKEFFDMFLDPGRRDEVFFHVESIYHRLTKLKPSMFYQNGEYMGGFIQEFLWSGHTGETFVRETPKVSRNSPCPCGSGKKYKQCCGK